MNLFVFTLLALGLIACGRRQPPKAEPFAFPVGPDTSGRTDVDTQYLRSGFYYPAGDTAGVRMMQTGTDYIYTIHPIPFVSRNHIQAGEIRQRQWEGQNAYSILLRLDGAGTRAWESGTGQRMHPQVAFVVGGRLVSVAETKTPMKGSQVEVDLSSLTKSEVEGLGRLISEGY